MNNVIDITSEYKRATRRNSFKSCAKQNLASIGDWIYRNKKMFTFFSPMVIGLTTATVKGISKRSNLKKEEHVKKHYCYDRSLGHYWELRRELSNKEWREIDRRKRNGERLADILSEFKVLK